MTTGSGDPNPAPPKSNSPGGPKPGGLFRRFVARLIDIWIAIFALVPVLYLLRALTDITAASWSVRMLVAGLLIGIATLAYFVAFEATLGWTPAKKLLGLAVHGPCGAPKPDLKQSAVRNAIQLLWIAPPVVGSWLVGISWIVIAVSIDRSPTNQGLHDRLAGGTQVVRSRVQRTR
jgi:uncharacterized RDD family membrane protein YckC